MKNFSLSLLSLFAFFGAFAQNQHIQVDVQSNFYAPADIVIDVGDTVTWTNMGGVHNVDGGLDVYPDNPVGFDNGPASSAMWTYTNIFTVPGFYNYHCTPHVALGMVGTVTVNEVVSPIGPIIITEIMYNNPGVDNLEFIELFNDSADDVDMSGWSFTAGIGYTFPAGTTLGAGQYLLLSIDPAAFMDAFFLPSVPFDEDTGLNNSGELIQLSDADGNVVDEVDYDDGGDWPAGTDGEGGSLVLCDFMSDNNDADNWLNAFTPTGVFVAGEQIYANPGGPSECPMDPIVGFVFEDITVNEDVGSFTVPVYVSDLGTGATNVSVSVSDLSSATRDVDYTIQDTLLAFAGDTDTLSVTITIIDDTDIETIETIILNISDTDGESIVDPLRDTYTVLIEDNDAIVQDIVISEIMYNPPGSDDLYEYLELYNNEAVAVNLTGYYFSAGVEDTLPDIILDAGESLVIAKDSATIAVTFGPILTQWEAGNLGNSGELIQLRDAFGNIVDEVMYSDSGDWPESADGAGPSLILCDYDGDNNLASNWQASAEATGEFSNGIEFLASPGETNDCDATPPMVDYPLYDIGDVNNVDPETGIADSLNVRAELRGVVYGNNLRPGGLQFTIIDDEGDGIGVFSANEDFGYDPMEGDLVAIQGIISQFNGLTQINVDSIGLLSQDNTLLDAILVDDLNEGTESQLIVLSGWSIVSITAAGGGFNVEITDATTTLLMRTDNDTGITEDFLNDLIGETLSITGIGGQFDTSEPFLDGYQILPRYPEDLQIIVSVDEPVWAGAVRLYPTPTRNNLTLELPILADRIDVLDSHGRTVLRIERPDQVQQVSVTHLPTGWYALRIQAEAEVYTTRFVKQ